MFGIIFLKISLFAFLMRYGEKRVCGEKILSLVLLISRLYVRWNLCYTEQHDKTIIRPSENRFFRRPSNFSEVLYFAAAASLASCSALWRRKNSNASAFSAALPYFMSRWARR